MDTVIITAIISGAVTLVVCLLNNLFTNKRTIDATIKKTEEAMSNAISGQHQEIAMLSYKLDTLNDKVEAHNNLVERTYKLETLSVQYGEIQHRLEQRIEDWHNDTLRRLDAIEGGK